MRLLLLSSVVCLLSPAAAGTGGYTMADSDGGAVTFAWDDITASSIVPFTLVDDDSATLPLPFTFTHFGVTFSSIGVCTNGFIQFGGASTAALNTAIPFAATPNGIVAGFWDDLLLAYGMNVHHATLGVSPNRRFVVSWDDVTTIIGGTSTHLTFQITLFETSNLIRLQYMTLTGSDSSGTSATVGIEALNGADGLEYLHDGAPAANALHDSLAILFTPGPGGGGPGIPIEDDSTRFYNCTNAAPASQGFVWLLLCVYFAAALTISRR